MKTLKYIVLVISIMLSYSNMLGQCVTPPTDNVSWWSGNNNAQDFYGNNHGTPQGSITYITGVVNNAFHFDGINDVVVVPHSNELDITGDVTIELWVRQTGFDNDIQTVLCKGAGEVPTNQPAVFLMRFETATTKFYFKDSLGDYIELLGPSFEDWQWHHYAYVRQGNQHILYADGFDFGWETFTNLPVSTMGMPLTIGAEYHNPTSSSNDYDRFFSGDVDEIGVYNRALSEVELQSIYNAGVEGKCSTALSSEDEFLLENQIQIYPNPVKNTFTLDISKSIFIANEAIELQVFDVFGSLVKQVRNLNTFKSNIDFKDLEPGMYLYQLIGDSTVIDSGKIIKK